MPALKKAYLSEYEYLQIERDSEHKSEYYQGEMFAMSGASLAHNEISSNINFALRKRFGNKPCRVFTSEMRVTVQENGLYTYPDLVIVCEKPELEDEHFDTLINPFLIIEILSPSTEAYDRGKKFEMYQKMESLQHYLLVAQDRPSVMHHSRQKENDWLLHTVLNLEDSIEIKDLEIEVKLTEIYERVVFEENKLQGGEQENTF